MAATAPNSAHQDGAGEARLALVAYFLIMVALLVAFAVVAAHAATQPPPPTVYSAPLE